MIINKKRTTTQKALTSSEKKPCSPRLAIVTQDPANYGGVLRLVEYIYRRSEAIGMEPALLHYGRYAEHGELHASFANLLRGELNVRPAVKRYSFRGMRAYAIGAYFPEWEPNRLAAHHAWRTMLDSFDAFLLVTGSAQTGLPLAGCNKPFGAWVSSTVATDRNARLSRRTIGNYIERLGLPAIHRAETQTLHAAQRLLAVSDDAARHIGSIAGRPVETWPYPVDTEKFSPANKKSEAHHRFLFVGRANDPRKRADLFLGACDALHRRHPGLAFEAVIVSKELNLSAARYEFPIQQLPNATEAELIALYRSSTALLVTSEQEGLGIAAMEAMACGLPVISTCCGGPEQFIDGGVNGFLVKNSATPEDIVSAIARHMAELVAHPKKLLLKMRKSARATIDHRFSEHVWNPKFENLLANMCAPNLNAIAGRRVCSIPAPKE